MTARWISRVGGAVFALALIACAQPVDQVGGAPVQAASTCSNGVCSGCTACFNMCMCGGATVAKCADLCATGAGGTSAGGSGGTTSTGGSSSGGTAGTDGGIGGTSFGGTGGVTSTCGVSVGDATCNTCMQSSCCTVAETCAYDQYCLDFMTCVTQAPECASTSTIEELLTCGETACPAQASGKPALAGYLGCLTTTCATSCGM